MFSGSMVALVTPMRADGSLDSDCLKQLVEFHIKEGTDAIVAVGTTGESATLTVEEHCEVIRLVVEQVNGRIPVIAGTGANSTSEAIELTQHAKGLGVDAVLLVTPYYNKPTQEGYIFTIKQLLKLLIFRRFYTMCLDVQLVTYYLKPLLVLPIFQILLALKRQLAI